MIDGSYNDKEINDSYGDIKKEDKSPINALNAKVSDADIFINPNDKWCDSWGISSRNNNQNEGLIVSYMNNWKKDKLTFSTKNDVSYFNLNSEVTAQPKDPQVIAKYHMVKILDEEGNEVVRYLREDYDIHLRKDKQVQYYTKVDNNKDAEGNVINYIIVDKNGNILTKPVTPPEVFGKTTVTENNKLSSDAMASDGALGDYWRTYTRKPKDDKVGYPERPGDIGVIKDGLYRMDDNHYPNRDYRIPALERVYEKSVFNLDESSCYSFFEIPELNRVNYLYLNVDEINQKVHLDDTDKYNWKVDDMFFTTKRVNWID